MCRLAAFPPEFERNEAFQILANFENNNTDGTGSAYVKNGQFVIDTRDWETQTGALDWEDIQTLDRAIVERTIQDDTVPNGPIERVIQYVAPFDLCSREHDYQTVWQYFESNNVY